MPNKPDTILTDISDISLPPMPTGGIPIRDDRGREATAHSIDIGANKLSIYSAEQMQAYARAAVLADRERCAEAWEAAHGFDKFGVGKFIRQVTESKQEQDEKAAVHKGIAKG